MGEFSWRLRILHVCNVYKFVVLVSGWTRGRDPTRPVHYEGGGSRTVSTDVVCPMYMRVWDIVKIAQDPNESRPVILCEYCSVCILPSTTQL
jgi:beta-galactosidase/beta-glucuronidase